jgi:hypothetical protein
MNYLDRTLIEKAGYDNGFEITQKRDTYVECKEEIVNFYHYFNE